MTPERWQRLKALFNGALDRPRDSRDDWLKDAADGDVALVGEARALLRAHEAGRSPLDAPLPPLDVAAADDASPLRPGTVVGGFRIERELGRGGMGIVYEAFDEQTRTTVALKVLAGAAATDQAMRKRLQNEALLAATIHHPGIAHVHRLHDADGHLLLATEYVRGESLRAEISRGPIALQRALALTRDILQALEAAHAAGVVHRDLKPENVMVASGGRVKIVDFGIARSERFALTRVTSGGPPGTPAYMAPEQLAGSEADARADLYAVGVILAEMVSGRHPGVPDQPPLSWPLQALIERSLSRDPAARYQSATEMVRAVDDLHDLKTSPDRVALGWWRFHQCAAAVVYGLMTIPVWAGRMAIGGRTGRALFLLVLAAVVVSSVLRLHLCFTSWYYPRHLPASRAQVAPTIRAGDVAFVGALALLALMLGDGHAPLMVLLLSVAVGALVAAMVIEPATTRAAFER